MNDTPSVDQPTSKASILIFIVVLVLIIGIISILINAQKQPESVDEIIGLVVSPTSALVNPNKEETLGKNLGQPSQEGSSQTTNWKQYAVPFLGVSIKVPPEWFIAIDEANPNRIRIRSASPEAEIADQTKVFTLDISKVEGISNIKSITDLRVELTKEKHNHLTSKGNVSGENEVIIDTLQAIYRQLQPSSGGLVQQLLIITKKGELGLIESVPKDQNQISLFTIIVSTIKKL